MLLRPLRSAILQLQVPPLDESVEVRVVAQQFAWNIHYPGPDGVFGKTSASLVDEAVNPIGLDANDPHALDDVTTVNQLHLPVDKPTILHLSSKDVIHSFGVPELRVKQDTIPGMNTPMWFTPTVTTAEMRKIKGNDEFTYEIACAQLCGIGHYRMKGYVTIHEQDEFDNWLANEEPAVGGAEDEDVW